MGEHTQGGSGAGGAPGGGRAAGGPLAGVIVGVGASAGGLEALEELFAQAPASAGIAYVVVQHLDPHQPSLLPELLGRVTAMPVREPRDGDTPEPGHVWVSPPDAVLTLHEGALRVSKPPEPGPRMPIDTFFRSLAEDRGELAVGVLLSGADSDGTLGLRAIKEHAGLTLAQAPATARHPTMPESAIQAGFVDVVQPVAEMPDRLLSHFRALGARMSIELQEAEARALLPKICERLRAATGHDLRHYKEGTLVRRVRRRAQLHRMRTVDDYFRYLSDHPAEPGLLLRDLLIGVTQLFRDPAAFEALAAHVLPEIAASASRERPIRVWVPGCATGEEAYSIAMLLHEQLGDDAARKRVQIFATDIDDRAIAAARAARYRDDIADHLSPARLGRHFQRDRGGYLVAKELRDMCVFSTHDLIRDPPFSSLDLVSCRNLLIYLDASLQTRVIPLFHHALRPSGFLFLGPSEELAGHVELFTPVDKKHRLFQRRDTLAGPALDLPLSSQPPSWRRPRPPAAEPAGRATKVMVNQAFERMILQEYAPPSAVVDARGEIVCVAGDFAKLLKPRPGLLTTNILDYTAGTLRHALRTALSRAAEESATVRTDVAAPSPDGPRHLRLTVRPAPGTPPDAGLHAVVLEDLGPAGDPPGGGPSLLPMEPVIEQLEDELASTRASLQSALEELETTNEELKSSNEELTSTNEELHSANEELRASKEDLQAANERLSRTNDELARTVAQLGALNADLQNLFAATQIATVFLDVDLRLARFTPAATALFHFIGSDVGRPLADLSPRFAGMELLPAVREVLATLVPIEQEAQAEGAWFTVRVMPYRAADGAVAGAVVTFSDVTRLKRAELRAREHERLLQHVIDGTPALIFIKDEHGRYTTVNRRLAELTGRTAEDLRGKTDFDVLPARADDNRELLRRVITTGETVETEETIDFGRGPSTYVASRFPLRDPAGRIYGVCALLLDITERKRMEESLRAAHERIATILESISDAFYSVDREWRMTYVNRKAAEIYGAKPEDMIGKVLWDLLPPPAEIDEAACEKARVAMETRQAAQLELLWRPLGQWLSIHLYPAEQGLSVYFQDITARKSAEEALRQADRRKTEFLAVLSHELRNPLAPIKNSLSIVRRVPPGDERAARAHDVISRQVNLLARLVDDLLDVTRISQNRIHLQRARVDLGDLVRRTVDDHRSLFEKAHVHLDADVPAEAVFVDGDATRLAQILGNLLQNAVKFTGAGGSTTVTLAPDPAGESAVLRVTDTGVGMTAEMLGRLFQPFAQADATLDRSQGGLGLGLALVKGLVELHGGDVAAASAGLDRGTEMTVRLPLDPSAPPRDAPPREADPGALQILLIEDNVDAADSLRDALHLSGHHPSVAYDGRQGLLRARDLRPDVVLCDIGLPGMSGYEVARAVRADEALRGVFLVAISGYAQPEDVRKALDAGFDRHLSKPFSLEKLEELLASVPR